MRKTILALALTGLLLGGSATSQTPGQPHRSWRIADAPAELRGPVARADLVILSLQDALLRELTGALDKGGPALAIQSCHIDVIGVTQRVARYEGVAAGRTSDRLRNPTNRPLPWAAPLVQANAGKLARDVDGFAVDLGDKVGVLRPIAHRPLCTSCHGPSAQLVPAVRAALVDRYPADRATGFTDGEIRGWFWVEVPKSPQGGVK